MGFIDKLQASASSSPFPSLATTDLPLQELELYRLERRYARRSHRSTFQSNAMYVDGEYIYASPTFPPTYPQMYQAQSQSHYGPYDRSYEHDHSHKDRSHTHDRLHGAHTPQMQAHMAKCRCSGIPEARRVGVGKGVFVQHVGMMA